MEMLKTFFNSYFWLIAIIALFAIGIAVFFIYSAYTEAEFEQTVQTNQTAAHTAVTESRSAETEAANFSVERKVEDRVREKVIAPKLESARRNSQNSKLELEKAKNKYENEKNNYPPVSSSVADNCFQLQRLFPNQRFEYCDGQNR